MNLHYVPLAKSCVDQVHIDIKDEICRSVSFVGGKNFSKITFQTYKNLIIFVFSINMVVLIDIHHCSMNA